MCVMMVGKTTPFIGRLAACLDTRDMRNASIMRFGSVNERLKRILANLEPKDILCHGVVHRLEGWRPPSPTETPLLLRSPPRHELTGDRHTGNTIKEILAAMDKPCVLPRSIPPHAICKIMSKLIASSKLAAGGTTINPESRTRSGRPQQSRNCLWLFSILLSKDS